MEKIKLVCKGCKKEFYVNKTYFYKKFCTRECYFKNGMSGENWKGSTRRGKGSRPNEPRSAVLARAKAKVDKHVKEFSKYIDFEKIEKMINLNYCNSPKMYLRFCRKPEFSDKNSYRMFLQVLRYNSYYEKIINIPDLGVCYKHIPPKEFEWFINLLKTCKDFGDLKSSFILGKTKNNFIISKRALLYDNIKKILDVFQFETNAFDKLGYSNRAESYNTIPENIVKKLLIDLNLDFSEQVHLKRNEFYNGRQKYFIPDFIVEKKLIIEVNGDYWHGFEKTYQKEDRIKYIVSKDKKKYKFYESKGYAYIVIWEHELKSNFTLVENKILKEVRNARNNKNII